MNKYRQTQLYNKYSYRFCKRIYISFLSNGCFLWADAAKSRRHQQLRDIYLHQYSAMSSKTSLIERWVKESGYLSLGQRNDTYRSVLAIAFGKTLEKALKRGREEI